MEKIELFVYTTEKSTKFGLSVNSEIVQIVTISKESLQYKEIMDHLEDVCNEDSIAMLYRTFNKNMLNYTAVIKILFNPKIPIPYIEVFNEEVFEGKSKDNELIHKFHPKTLLLPSNK